MTTFLADNTNTANRYKVSDISIVDDGLGTNTLSLSGADAGAFEVVGSALFVKAGTVLNFDTKSSYAVTVNVDDVTVSISYHSSTNFTLLTSDVPN